MRKVGLGLAWIGLSLIGCVREQRVQVAQGQPKSSECEFRRDMHDLWGEHVAWTRFYLVSAVEGLPDKIETAQRLLQNQADIGNAMRPYYGDVFGNKLTALLKDHILIAGELIDAGKAGEIGKQAGISRRWHANSDDISVLLSGVNPKNWPLVKMKAEMSNHLDLATAEFAAHLRKDWGGDIAAYDRLHRQILEMADMLSMGIVSQFPEKFD